MPATKKRRISPVIRQRARDLRRPLTPTEGKLWARLRARPQGLKFRRQHPLGRFIVDFYCAQARLAIEVDGGLHAEPRHAEYDTARTAWLEQRGYRVLRFQARQVEKDLEAVVKRIVEACEGR